MKYMNRRKRKTYLDDDPMSSVANLFDVAMIFAIGLLVVALTHFGVEELITQSDVTIVMNPGQENMQVIIKQGDDIEKLELTKEMVSTSGRKFGTIYQTDSGGWMLVKEASGD
jgi:hypothetical protein